MLRAVIQLRHGLRRVSSRPKHCADRSNFEGSVRGCDNNKNKIREERERERARQSDRVRERASAAISCGTLWLSRAINCVVLCLMPVRSHRPLRVSSRPAAASPQPKAGILPLDCAAACAYRRGTKQPYETAPERQTGQTES